MKGLVTIIIPVYGVEKYISKCVQSILDQTYTNLEIIPVDDGSKDNCGAILDEFARKDNRIKVIHKQNEGLIAARKSGFGVSTGEYILFVDGDDWLEPDAVEVLYEKAEQEKADVTFGLYHGVDENGKEVFRSAFLHESLSLDRDQYIKLMFNQKISGSVCVKLYRRHLFTPQSFSFARKYAAGEDHLINCETFKYIQRAAGVPDVLYNYYMREDSICHTFFPTIEYYTELYNQAEQAMGEEIATTYKDYHDRAFLQIYVDIIIATLMKRHVSYCGSQPYKQALSLARKQTVKLLPFRARLRLFLVRNPVLFYTVARAYSLLRGRGWLKFTKFED